MTEIILPIPNAGSDTPLTGLGLMRFRSYVTLLHRIYSERIGQIEPELIISEESLKKFDYAIYQKGVMSLVMTAVTRKLLREMQENPNGVTLNFLKQSITGAPRELYDNEWELLDECFLFPDDWREDMVMAKVDEQEEACAKLVQNILTDNFMYKLAAQEGYLGALYFANILDDLRKDSEFGLDMFLGLAVEHKHELFPHTYHIHGATREMQDAITSPLKSMAASVLKNAIRFDKTTSESTFFRFNSQHITLMFMQADLMGKKQLFENAVGITLARKKYIGKITKALSEGMPELEMVLSEFDLMEFISDIKRAFSSKLDQEERTTFHRALRKNIAGAAKDIDLKLNNVWTRQINSRRHSQQAQVHLA